jgi:hypothetical protein
MASISALPWRPIAALTATSSSAIASASRQAARGIDPGLQRDAVRRRGADQRCAADPHLGDRAPDRGGIGQRLDHQAVRQPALVDHLHCITPGCRPDRAGGDSGDAHTSDGLGQA